jgi:transcription initiation factor IIE alpha subunit
MSTPNIPSDDWTRTPVRKRRDTTGGSPSLVAELVLRELLESDAPLTEGDLNERTLLPESEVREALAELEARNLCTARRRRTDREARRYVASFPSGTGR